MFIREEGTKRKRRRRRKSEGRSMRPQTGIRVQGREGILVETNAYGPFLGAGSSSTPPPPPLCHLTKAFPLSTHRSRKTKRKETFS